MSPLLITFLQLKIVLNSLWKCVNKIQDVLKPVLTLSPFSLIYLRTKLSKSAVTHFISQELLSKTNKNQFEKILRAALCNNLFSFGGLICSPVDGVALR